MDDRFTRLRSVFFLVFLTWCSLSAIVVDAESYRFVVTEDFREGVLGKINAPERLRNPVFFLRDFQPFVNVEQRTGILRLQQSLHIISKDRNGVRYLKFGIVVTSQQEGFRQFLYGPRRVRPHDYVVIVEVFVLPKYFGDKLLRQYGNRLRSGIVRPSSLRSGNTPQNFHRLQRIMSPKTQPKSFHVALSAIKVEKVMHLAVKDILRKFFGRGSQNEFHMWSSKSLFSRSALTQLAVQAGCQHNKVIRCESGQKYRSADGTCNNLRKPRLGSSPTVFNRLVPAVYYDVDGHNDPILPSDQPRAPNLPSPFKVAQDLLVKRRTPLTSEVFSHALMQWGQWLDHDLDLSPESQSSDNCENTPCDGSQADYEPPCYTIVPMKNNKCIHFRRTAAECQVENGRIITREQMNINTAFVDASQLYGSNKQRMDRLRDLAGRSGLLRTERTAHGDLLTRDRSGLMAPNNLCFGLGDCFAAGDNRASETTVLASMHNLFLREHNRIAIALKQLNPRWDGETLFQEARKICAGVAQKITYTDYLPIIIGNTLPGYRGYDPNIDPGIVNAFATAVFRFGHSMIRPVFDILDANFEPIGDPIPVRHLFFNNTFIRRHGIDPLLLGLLGNASEKVDRIIAADLLEKLFERPNHPALNLAALNIQRSRDHGLGGYNAYRRYCRLTDARTFQDTRREIRSGVARSILADLYNDDPNLADLWPAGLSEDPANGGIVGPTFGCVIREQMRRLRDGDSQFYQRPGVFTIQQVAEIEKTSLSRILCDNLQSIVSIQRNAFMAGVRGHRRVECGQIAGMDLSAWKEFR